MIKTDIRYLRPTAMIDSDSAAIRAFAKEITTGVDDPGQKAVHLFYAVRDGVQYDPYTPFYRPEPFFQECSSERNNGSRSNAFNFSRVGQLVCLSQLWQS